MKQSLFTRLFSARDCRVADAPRNDGIKKDAPRNDEKKSVQFGRSMIEMLGVLAIIGVLSIGGIAGYTKAMMKLKINKTLDQITQIVTNIQTMYFNQKSYIGLNTQSAIISGIVPREMYSSEQSNRINHALGGSIDIDINPKNDVNDNKAFFLRIHDLTKESCITLSSIDWAKSNSNLIWVGIRTTTTGFHNEQQYCPGYITATSVQACVGGAVLSPPIPPSIASSICKADKNTLLLKYY